MRPIKLKFQPHKRTKSPKIGFWDIYGHFINNITIFTIDLFDIMHNLHDKHNLSLMVPIKIWIWAHNSQKWGLGTFML